MQAASGAGAGAAGGLLYLGPASGATRAALLQALSAERATVLKDALAMLGVDRGGCLEKRDFADRLLSAVPHALLIRATPEAAAACHAALPTPDEEAAALQGLLAAVQAEPPDRHHNAAVFRAAPALLGGHLEFVAAPCYWALAAKVQMMLGQPLLRTDSSGAAAAAGSAGSGGSTAGSADSASSGDGADEQLVQQINAMVGALVERAAAQEGRRASDLPPSAMGALRRLAGGAARGRSLLAPASAACRLRLR